MTAIQSGPVQRPIVQPSTVDEYVSAIAHNVVQGNQDEAEGRSQILSCLMGSPAITAMTDLCRYRMPSSGEVMLDAVRSECEKRLKSKVLADDGTGVDLLQLT